jgi:hypothetical protein
MTALRARAKAACGTCGWRRRIDSRGRESWGESRVTLLDRMSCYCSGMFACWRLSDARLS